MTSETVEDLTSKNNTAQIANTFTPVEEGLTQLALKKMVQNLNNHRISTTQDRLVIF